MKMVFKTGVFFVLISLFTLNLSAQTDSKVRKEANTKESTAKQQAEKIAIDLGLNADQKAKIKEINKKYYDQRKQKSEKEKAVRLAQKEEMKKSREAKEAEIKAVLTPEQFEKWQNMQKDGRKKMNNKQKKENKNNDKKRKISR